MDETHPTTAWETYLVEGYYPGASAETLQRSARRLRAAVEQMAGAGEPVRYLRSTIVPEDESCLILVEAASEAVVREAYDRARVHFERISTALPVEESEPKRRVKR